MTLDLPRLARQQGRRRNITLRPVQPTQANATDLARIIAPAWRVWGESIDRIMARYDPPPLAADAMLRDNAERIGAEIEGVATAFRAMLVTTVTPALRRWAVRVEEWHRRRWSSAVLAGTGVDLSTVLTAGPATETLEAFIARNVALVRNISDQAQGRIADAVFRGYQQRLPAREVARSIREAVDMGRRRAIGIASDQLSKLSGALDTERMAEAGIDLWKFRHSGKRHPREEHLKRDGRIYTLSGNKQVNPDGSPMQGGDVIEPGMEPSQPPWCGCRKQGYIPLMSEID